MRKFSTLDSRNRIGFESKSTAADTFCVIDLRGEEGLSRPYRFEINLVSDEPAIDLKSMLTHDVMLSVVHRGVETRYHGMLEEFEELHQKDDDTFYRAVLVPRLWQLSLFWVNEVYVDKTVPEVIEAVLQEAGLTTLDYELSLTADYTPWTHLCEYQETHLDFISRLMEREGIYYYFSNDGTRDKVVITDNRMRHQAPPTGARIDYTPASGLQVSGDNAQLLALVCKQRHLPKTLVLMDYNYRKPSLDLKSEVTVDENGRGEVYLYGEHADTIAESRFLAGIRAEELRCRARTFHGESSVNLLRSGFLAEVAGHFRREFNRQYLVLDIDHEASQVGDVLRDASGTRTTGDAPPFYRNTFTAIASDLQFRPERATPKPRIHGTMNAVIDAEGSGTEAELDVHGRYKVRVTFDRTRKGDAKASQSVRMMTPYAGTDYGMHYPLRKGTEVLLTFIDGDPNRPIIAGAVPNADTPSVANTDNETRVVTRIRGGIENIAMPSRRTALAGVGAQAVYTEDKTDDTQNDETALFGTLPWEDTQGWKDDVVTFDLTGGPDKEGIRTLTTMNNVLHLKGVSCERYLGEVVTTIVGNNNLTVRGSVHTYIGAPDSTPRKNAETCLANYASDVTAERGGSDSGNVASMAFAKMFQVMADDLSNTRSAANPPGSSVTYIEGTSRTTVRGTNVSLILGDSDTTVQSDSFNKYLGRTNNFFAGNTFLLYLGAQETVSISNNLAINLGLAETINIGGSMAATLGAALSLSLAGTYELYTGIKVATKIGGDYEVAIVKGRLSVSKSDSAVTDLKARVSTVESVANDVKAKANELVAATNKLDAGMNHLATYNTKLSSAPANIDTNGIKLIG